MIIAALRAIGRRNRIRLTICSNTLFICAGRNILSSAGALLTTKTVIAYTGTVRPEEL
jgi:hypothetical protein